jgi:FixJ family two-component response regulator
MFSSRDTLYIVDPDESVHDAITTLLDSVEVRVESSRAPEDFLADFPEISSTGCALLIEADLSGIGSLELIRRVRARDPRVPIIVLASTNDSDIAAQALKAGAIDVIDKPLIGVHILERILGVAADARYATSP